MQRLTLDDPQAGTAFHNAPGLPNRSRVIRDKRWKCGAYFDPSGRTTSEYELCDMGEGPAEARNLLDKRTGEGHTAATRSELPRLRALLERAYQWVGAKIP